MEYVIGAIVGAIVVGLVLIYIGFVFLYNLISIFWTR